jgi:hypothetical protein
MVVPSATDTLDSDLNEIKPFILFLFFFYLFLFYFFLLHFSTPFTSSRIILYFFSLLAQKREGRKIIQKYSTYQKNNFPPGII